MIYLREIQLVVNEAYSALAFIQYKISVKTPVTGGTRSFDKHYVLSTRILANLEYINMMNLNVSYTDNVDIENTVEALKRLIYKTKELCR